MTDADLTRALEDLGRAQYVSLTTFRRSGEGVATPVWIARDGDTLLVITNDNVGKTKRLANDSRVTLRPCDVRGRIADGAPTYAGTAVVVRSAAEVAVVKRAMSSKYLLARIGNTAEGVLGRFMGRAPRAGIRITLTPGT